MKRTIRMSAAAVALVTLAACTRMIGHPTAVPATSTSSLGATSPAEATMDAIRAAFLTQTAVANPQMNPAASATPGAPQPTATFVALATVPVGTSFPTSTPMATQTPTSQPYASPTPGVPETYTLQKGEFPYCIARRLNVDPVELMSLNNLTNGDLYQPGLTLKIPQSGHVFGSDRAWHSHPGTYTVQSGDSIYGVACWFGDVDPLQIAAINGLSSPYTLTPGQSLNIP
jgi:LysM repeat protein